MAITINKFDPIEFLLRKRFGLGISQNSLTPLHGEHPALTHAHEEERLRKREAYEKELRALSPDELNERVRTVIAKDTASREEKFTFNRPAAKATPATYNHWVKAAYWERDEAIALLIERNPDFMSWKHAQSVLTVSQVAAQFAKLHELVSRAQTMNQLSIHTTPGVFIAWAKRNRIDVPSDLEDAVLKHGHQVADWKTVHDQQKARADTAEAALMELQQKTEQLQPAPTAKGLSTKERESLLKLVICMAVDGYGYDPAAARSPIPKEITDLLITRGLLLDQDTVRKYLKEAGVLLPQQDESDE